MDISHPHLLSTECIIEILLQRQVQNIEHLSRPELIEIYNRVALPLPQRESRRPQYGNRQKLEPEKKIIQLKRKSETSPTNVEKKVIKLVRDGINDLKLEKKKRMAEDNQDDPMQGQSRSKRQVITWP